MGHAAGIFLVRVDEDFDRPGQADFSIIGKAFRHNRLPPVVDLHDAESEGLQTLGGELRGGGHPLFVRGAGMIPRTIDRRLRRKLDVILFRDGVGVGFEPEPRVAEQPDDHRVRWTVRAGCRHKMSEVEPSGDSRLPPDPLGQEGAESVFMRQPTENDAATGFGIGGREKGVAPRGVHTVQPAGSQRSNSIDRNADFIVESSHVEPRHRERLAPRVRGDGPQLNEGKTVEQPNDRREAADMSDSQLLAVSPNGIVHRPPRHLFKSAREFAAYGKRLADRRIGNTQALARDVNPYLKPAISNRFRTPGRDCRGTCGTVLSTIVGEVSLTRVDDHDRT